MKNSKKFDLLKICKKYFLRSTYNHVQTDVPKKHIYLASPYDGLLAVLVQIYKIRTHQINIPYDRLTGSGGAYRMESLRRSSVRRPSSLSKDFFSETTRPNVPKFHM